MKPPEEEVIGKIVGRWLRKADLDIDSAEALLSRDIPLLYPSCFHSQQAAEKYLKAYLTCHQVEFPKTHNIGQILDLVGTVDGSLAKELEPATALTPYGVDIRYPQDTPEPNLSDAREATDLARKVRDAIRQHLGGIEPLQDNTPHR